MTQLKVVQHCCQMTSSEICSICSHPGVDHRRSRWVFRIMARTLVQIQTVLQRPAAVESAAATVSAQRHPAPVAMFRILEHFAPKKRNYNLLLCRWIALSVFSFFFSPYFILQIVINDIAYITFHGISTFFPFSIFVRFSFGSSNRQCVHCFVVVHVSTEIIYRTTVWSMAG